MPSSLPPLPNTDVAGVDDGLAVDPKALPDLEANPPNAEPLDVVFASLAPAEAPNALKPVPALGCVVGVVFAPKGEDEGEPNAEVVPNAEVEPKPDDEPKAGVDV